MSISLTLVYLKVVVVSYTLLRFLVKAIDYFSLLLISYKDRITSSYNYKVSSNYVNTCIKLIVDYLLALLFSLTTI
jgi:hypothetical protein